MINIEIIENIVKSTFDNIEGINEFIEKVHNETKVVKGHLFESVFDIMQRCGCIYELKGFERLYGKEPSLKNMDLRTFLM
jgi:hypothetical protein